MRGIEQVLVNGSDPRLLLDPSTGLNRYGCAPAPQPGSLSYSSSTASTISPEAFRQVCAAYEEVRETRCLDAAMETLRSELKDLLGLAGMGTEIVFSPSGTDSTLQALFLVRALSENAPLDCILTVSDETGSGVPLALAGRHFSDRTSEGAAVVPGEIIAGLGEDVHVISLPRRSANGAVRPLSCLDQDVWEAVERSAEAGRQVLLQVMDCSKLGTSSPSTECVRRIQARFAGSVHVVVDACQMRLSRKRLREYLAQDCLVLISGSKFFTGPPFSGALLVPKSLAAELKTLPLNVAGLKDYTSRCAWPPIFSRLRASLPDRLHLGQHLRWTAALAEMRAYYAVPSDFRCRALQQFGTRVTTLLQSHAPDIQLLGDGSESIRRTIFPFFVRQSNEWMSTADTNTLYKALAADRCLIGQPVRLQTGPGQEAGALRISADARLVSRLWSQQCAAPRGALLADQEQEIILILAKITQIVHNQIKS